MAGGVVLPAQSNTVLRFWLALLAQGRHVVPGGGVTHVPARPDACRDGRHHRQWGDATRFENSSGVGAGNDNDIPLLQRKPGPLRNGAPFADMPEPLQQLRRALLRSLGGDRVMAQVLAIVPTTGLDAVLVAVEFALETGSPSGRLSVQHVVNVLGRWNATPVPPNAATTLQVITKPSADTARYDSPRADTEGGRPCVT